MKKHIVQKAHKHERGQSLVEMALSLIVMLFLLLGAVEFSIALFQYVTISDAAQEGAVFGSINPADADGIRDRALATASDILVLDASQVAVNLVGDEYCEGLSDSGAPNAIEIVVTYPHEIIMPLVTPMIGTETINLQVVTTNTILNPSCG
jgi:Flp pilus assembly protein TadG